VFRSSSDVVDAQTAVDLKPENAVKIDKQRYPAERI
jgi:hypothetical protein